MKRCTRIGCGGRTYLDSYDDEWVCHACSRRYPVSRVVPLELPKIPQRISNVHKQAQLDLLWYIREHPGLTSSQIARGMGVSPGGMRSRLDNLWTSHQVIKLGDGGQVDPYRWVIAQEEEASA